MRTQGTAGLLALGLALALVVPGCATTEKTGQVKFSGFLRDYSRFEPGTGDQATLVYLDPEADFSRYDAVRIDPVTIWRQRGSSVLELSREEQQALADALYAALHRELAKDWRIAERPGPGVLRVRVGITEARGASVVGNVVSTVLPQARLLSATKKLATGTHAFVGEAAVEAEILDSLSNARLAAAMDDRAGGKTLRGATSTWADVYEAFDLWAQRMRERLAELRAQGSPTA